MANWHTRAQVISRQVKGRDGKPLPGKHNSLVAAMAYRGALTLTDSRNKERYDYSGKAKGVLSSVILAPPDAPAWMGDPGKLANAIERREDQQNRHASAQLARELENSLPVELTDEQNAALAYRFAQRLVSLGMIVQLSIHEPQPYQGQRNPHVHFLCLLRGLDPTSPDGLGHKRREWNDKALYETLLDDWERMTNEALADAGSTARVDRRSFAEQGIDRLPSVHWGRAATALMRERKKRWPDRVVKAEHRQIENALRPVRRSLQTHGEVYQAGLGNSGWERLAFLAARHEDSAHDLPTGEDGSWQQQVTARRDALRVSTPSL